MADPRKQTEIGEIPNSWEVVLCEDLCDLITVGIVVTPAKYYVPAGVPCFRSFNIKPNRLTVDDLVFISHDSNELHSKSQLRTGDVLVVRTGYPGTACVVPPQYDGANCIDLLIARPNAHLVDGRYLAAYLNSPEGKTQVAQQQGGLAQQHYNVGALRRLKVPLPPLDEQAAIAAVVEMMRARAEKESAIFQKLADLRSTTMARLLRHGLADEPRKQSEIGEVPESWQIVRLGDLLSLSSGKTRPEDLSLTPTGECIFPVYGGNGVMGYSSRYSVETPTLVIGRVGVYSGCVHITSEKGWITDNALFQRDPLPRAVGLGFLAEALRMINLGSVRRAGAQPLVTQGEIMQLSIALPPIDQQERIAEAAHQLDRAHGVAKETFNLLESASESMIAQLMTGSIRLKSFDRPEALNA